MRSLRIALFFVPLSLSGCLDLPAQWEKPDEDRSAALGGQCRSYGLVPGSSKFYRCVEMKDHDESERERADRDTVIEARRAAGTTYSKQADQAASRPIWMECKTFPEGQNSCVGR